jgi:hypothetical protein
LVYKPSALTRELRKLYAQYQVLKKQIRVYKNTVQAVLADNGIVLSRVEKNHLLSEKYGKQMLEELDVSEASRISITVNLELLWNVLEKKEELVMEILRLKRPPSAIFVCNEPVVSGCVLALKEMGLSIPRDIALIGFDDPVWASCMDPPLTAVSQPSYTMGIQSFDYLLAKISGSGKDKKFKEDVIFKPTLIIRKSCGFKFKKRGPNLA